MVHQNIPWNGGVASVPLLIGMTIKGYGNVSLVHLAGLGVALSCFAAEAQDRILNSQPNLSPLPTLCWLLIMLLPEDLEAPGTRVQIGIHLQGAGRSSLRVLSERRTHRQETTVEHPELLYRATTRRLNGQCHTPHLDIPVNYASSVKSSQPS